MHTSIQSKHLTSPFANASTPAKSDSAAGKAKGLHRTDSAAQMDTSAKLPTSAKAAQPQTKPAPHGPRGGKNDSAYEGPKLGSSQDLHKEKIAFLIQKADHELKGLHTRLAEAMHRATASGYRDGVAVARRDSLSREIHQVYNRRNNLLALQAGESFPALCDEMGLAQAAMALGGPQAAKARARYEAVTAAMAQYAAGK